MRSFRWFSVVPRRTYAGQASSPGVSRMFTSSASTSPSPSGPRPTQLQNDDEVIFAYKAAATRSDQLDPIVMARVVSLYHSLFPSATRAPLSWYLPYYHLERAILGYPNWIVPTNRTNAGVLLMANEEVVGIPMFTERPLFEKSEYNWKHDALGVETDASQILATAKKIGEQHEGKTVGLMFNPTRDETGSHERMYPVSRFLMMSSLEVEECLMKLNNAMIGNALENVTAPMLETIGAFPFLLLRVEDKATRTMKFQLNQEDPVMTRLVLNSAIDVALAARVRLANVHGVELTDVKIEQLPLKRVLGLAKALPEKVAGIEIVFGWRPESFGSYRLVVDDFSKLRELFQSRGVDL